MKRIFQEPTINFSLGILWQKWSRQPRQEGSWKIVHYSFWINNMQLPTGVMYVSNVDLFTFVLLFDCEKSRLRLNMFRLVFVYKRFWFWKMYTFLFTVQVLCETNKGRPSSKGNFNYALFLLLHLKDFSWKIFKRILEWFSFDAKKVMYIWHMNVPIII